VRRFPTREADVAALARQIISGFKEKPDDFPSPPLDIAELEACLDDYEKTHADAVQARAAAAGAYKLKDEALRNLIYGMKSCLRYAEHAVRYNGNKLKAIGWRKRRDAAPPSVPGQARNLKIKREGPGWICLEWKKPEDGGVVTTYQVELYDLDEHEWQTVEICFDTMTVLVDQETKVDLVFRVVPINKTGAGLASNTVTAVL